MARIPVQITYDSVCMGSNRTTKESVLSMDDEYLTESINTQYNNGIGASLLASTAAL